MDRCVNSLDFNAYEAQLLLTKEVIRVIYSAAVSAVLASDRQWNDGLTRTFWRRGQ